MDKIISAFVSVVSIIFGNLSPVIREDMSAFVRGLWTKAKATSNPFDDIAVKVLAATLGVPLE
jgi:hypothetical protein